MQLSKKNIPNFGLAKIRDVLLKIGQLAGSMDYAPPSLLKRSS